MAMRRESGAQGDLVVIDGGVWNADADRLEGCVRG